jgi:hypothetical protein
MAIPHPPPPRLTRESYIQNDESYIHDNESYAQNRESYVRDVRVFSRCPALPPAPSHWPNPLYWVGGVKGQAGHGLIGAADAAGALDTVDPIQDT